MKSQSIHVSNIKRRPGLRPATFRERNGAPQLPNASDMMANALGLIAQHATDDGQFSARIFLLAGLTLLRMNGSDSRAVDAVIVNLRPYADALLAELQGDTTDD